MALSHHFPVDVPCIQPDFADGTAVAVNIGKLDTGCLAKCFVAESLFGAVRQCYLTFRCYPCGDGEEVFLSR
jgi:hypothetical protein